MKQAEIKKELHQHFRTADHLYNDMLEEFELEVIHDFRVEIKKIRAFMRLLNTGVIKNKRIKLSEELKECYRIAGEIRNLQLHTQRVLQLCQNSQMPLPVSYLNIFSIEEKMKRQECRNVGKDISFREAEHNAISNFHHRFSGKDINYYMEQKNKVLESFLLLPFLADDDLHSLRKILKDLLYNWSYVTSEVKLLPKLFRHKKKIEELTTKLGDFYDLCMAVSFFSDDYVAETNEEEKGLCYLLKRYFEENKTELKGLIISMLYLGTQEDCNQEIIVEVFTAQ